MSAAPETGTRISIDEDVDLLDEQIQALTELGQKEPADDADIYDLSIRWGAALAGRLRRLVHYSSLGLLDDADERRFQSVCDQLRAASALIDRFGVARPTLPDR